jgi:hypothetical protein
MSQETKMKNVSLLEVKLSAVSLNAIRVWQDVIKGHLNLIMRYNLGQRGSKSTTCVTSDRALKKAAKELQVAGLVECGMICGKFFIALPPEIKRIVYLEERNNHHLERIKEKACLRRES